jgi:hypothetical protein
MLLETSNNISSDDLPHMEAEGIQLWAEIAGYTNCYLEYGAGKSTIFIAKYLAPKKIVAIDSSLPWLNKILSTLVEEGKSASTSLLHADVGEVGDWGVPKSDSHFRTHYLYFSLPWQFCRQQGLNPTCILIDGRFRVACFLFSLLAADVGTRILFDDYTDRPEYHVVSQFLKPIRVAGRMALFEVTEARDISEIARVLLTYSHNFD